MSEDVLKAVDRMFLEGGSPGNPPREAVGICNAMAPTLEKEAEAPLPRYSEPKVEPVVLKRALHDWLNNKRIWDSILRAGVAKREALLEMYANLQDLAPEAVEALTCALVRDRSVRLQIARHMEKLGHKRADTMRDLGKFAELWREQINKPVEAQPNA